MPVLTKQALAKKYFQSENHAIYKEALLKSRIFTVCQEARCPNISECFRKGEVTFLILGDTCTRHCGFCSVKKGKPGRVDPGEPERIARFVRDMRLKYAVVTSVTRDDLPDAGLGHYMAVVKEVRKRANVPTEILTPDFRGVPEAGHVISGSDISVFGHNVETVPRLYKIIRSGADYGRSLELLRDVKKFSEGRILTKSSLMLGLGEEGSEVTAVLKDLKAAGCDIVTIGQYLRPDRDACPVSRYVTEKEFEDYRAKAIEIGIKFVLAGPFVRSSYRARELYMEAKNDRC